MVMNTPAYMTVAEARDYLGVSKKKIAELIEEGVLPSESNPLDKRSKLVLRSAVEELKAKVSHGAQKKDAA